MATQYSYLFQDRGHGIRDVRTGKFFPYRTYQVSSGTPLQPAKNQRFFVRSVQLSYASLAGDVGTELVLKGPVNLQDNILARIVKTGSVVNHDTKEFNPRILVDREEPLTFTASDITTSSCIVVIAEVDDVI